MVGSPADFNDLEFRFIGSHGRILGSGLPTLLLDGPEAARLNRLPFALTLFFRRRQFGYQHQKGNVSNRRQSLSVENYDIIADIALGSWFLTTANTNTMTIASIR